MTGGLLGIITNYIYNVDHSISWDKKIYDFANEMIFDTIHTDEKISRDRSLARFIKSPAIMVGCRHGTPSRKRLPKNKLRSLKQTKMKPAQKITPIPSDPNELCDRLTLLMQDKEAGNKSNEINKEKINSAEKLLEHKCKFLKQHRFFLENCSNPVNLTK